MTFLRSRAPRWRHLLALGCASIFVLCLVTPRAEAQPPPSEINYQGRLTDLAGAPITGTVSMTFRLHDTEVGGSSLWEETQPSVSVDEGIFTTLLGSVEPFDTWGLDFSQQFWLEIVVDGDSMGDRMPLVPTPYAHYAMNAGLLDGVVVEELEESQEVADAIDSHETDFHANGPHESRVLQIDATSDLDVEVAENAGSDVAEKTFSFTAEDLAGADYLAVEVTGKFEARSRFYENHVSLDVENLATGATVFGETVAAVFGSSYGWDSSQCWHVPLLVALTEDEQANGTQIRLRVTATIDQTYLASMHRAAFGNSQIVFSTR
jgi:hypothetical protein